MQVKKVSRHNLHLHSLIATISTLLTKRLQYEGTRLIMISTYSPSLVYVLPDGVAKPGAGG
jgi:hypothetical protein